MRFLYLDNFRGFSNTVIPLKPVNFLVGENSTGKTSLLALLNLLSSSSFWLSQDFNSADYEFGGFKDILSKPYEIGRLSSVLHELVGNPTGQEQIV